MCFEPLQNSMDFERAYGLEWSSKRAVISELTVNLYRTLNPMGFLKLGCKHGEIRESSKNGLQLSFSYSHLLLSKALSH